MFVYVSSYFLIQMQFHLWVYVVPLLILLKGFAYYFLLLLI